MRFFLDEGVPHEVGRRLQKHGHEVLFLEEKVAKGSKDNLVAAVAEANSAILVAFDHDFKSIAQRVGIGRTRFRQLSLLRFEKCRESQAADRIDEAISLIEHEWRHRRTVRDRRLFMVITANTIRTNR